jgi:hypothetical protein
MKCWIMRGSAVPPDQTMLHPIPIGVGALTVAIPLPPWMRTHYAMHGRTR